MRCIQRPHVAQVLRQLFFCTILCTFASIANSAPVVPPAATMVAATGSTNSHNTPLQHSAHTVASLERTGSHTTQPLSHGPELSALVDPGWLPLIQRLSLDGFAPDLLHQFFSRLPGTYTAKPMGKKMREMYYRKFIAPKKARASAPKKQSAKPRIYPGVIVPKNLAHAKTFMNRHRAVLDEVELQYGVPKEIAVGLMLVETRLGAYLGDVKAFLNLACLASTTTVPQVKPHLTGYKFPSVRMRWLKKSLQNKSDWAYKELKALITYASENSLDPVSIPGSIYGAIGICQFMPSNIPHFGVDGNNDGMINLFHVPDAAHSLANYLKKHGWKPGIQRDKQQKVLYRYNRSRTYANTILAVADAIDGF